MGNETKKDVEIVKVVVLKNCRDKETKAPYEVGAEIELSAERAEAGVAAGLVEIATPEL